MNSETSSPSMEILGVQFALLLMARRNSSVQSLYLAVRKKEGEYKKSCSLLTSTRGGKNTHFSSNLSQLVQQQDFFQTVPLKSCYVPSTRSFVFVNRGSFQENRLGYRIQGYFELWPYRSEFC